MVAEPATLPLTSTPQADHAARAGRARPFLVREVAVAVIVVLLAELGVRVVASHLPQPQTWPTPEAQEKIDQLSSWQGSHPHVGLVVGGASMADVAVDAGDVAGAVGPGEAGYNAALEGSPLAAIAPWLTKVVVPRLRPRVVVLGLSPIELNPNVAGEAATDASFLSVDPIARALGRESWLQRLNRWAGDVSYLFRYRTQLRAPSSWTTARPAHPDNPALTADGRDLRFAPLTMSQFDTVFTNLRDLEAQIARTEFDRFTVGPQQVAQVGSLVRQLRAEGAAVVVVDLPVAPEALGLMPRGDADRQAVATSLANISQQTGARFIDAGVWPDTLFADPIHLNAAGASRLTSRLRADLSGAAGG